MQTKNWSNQKIIIFITFICAALMSSLFVYHAQHTQKNIIPQDEGFIFPTPRHMNTFTLMTANEEPFTEKNLKGFWTLMFFGFTHCASICPNALNILQHVYNDLHAQYPNMQIVFVSIDPERDTPTKLQQYINDFNPKFIGVTGKIEALRKLQAQLGIYAERENNSSPDYQIQHTSSILLINPHGEWAGVYKYDLPIKVLSQNIKKAISVG